MKIYRCDTECVMNYGLEDNMICCHCCPNRLDCAESCDSESCYIIRKIAIDKGEY